MKWYAAGNAAGTCPFELASFNGLAPVHYNNLTWAGAALMGMDKDHVDIEATPGDPVTFLVPKAYQNSVTAADGSTAWMQFPFIKDLSVKSGGPLMNRCGERGSNADLYYQYHFNYGTPGFLITPCFTTGQDIGYASGASFDPRLIRKTWPYLIANALPEYVRPTSDWVYPWGFLERNVNSIAVYNGITTVNNQWHWWGQQTTADDDLKWLGSKYTSVGNLANAGLRAVTTGLEGNLAMLQEHIGQTAIEVVGIYSAAWPGKKFTQVGL
jgi:hypothetical protein